MTFAAEVNKPAPAIIFFFFGLFCFGGYRYLHILCVTKEPNGELYRFHFLTHEFSQCM